MGRYFGRSKILLYFACLTLAVILYPATGQNCYLRGEVIEKESGAPVTAAVVYIEKRSLFRADETVVLSDPNGDYEYFADEPGRYTVSVYASGYRTWSRSIKLLKEETVILKTNLIKAGLTGTSDWRSDSPPLVLGVVRGTHLKDPLEGVAVLCIGPLPKDSSTYQAVSEKNGVFGLVLDAPGQYCLSVHHPQYRDTGGIEIVAVDGETKIVDIYMCLNSTDTNPDDMVRGTVVDAQTGNAIPDATISILGASLSITANEFGAFRLPPTASETYGAVVTATGYDPVVIDTRMPKTPDTLYVVLHRSLPGYDSITLSGVVKREGERVAGALVSLEEFPATCETDSDGVFAFSPVPRNEYTVIVVSNGESVVYRTGKIAGGGHEFIGVDFPLPTQAVNISDSNQTVIAGIAVDRSTEAGIAGVGVRVYPSESAGVSDRKGCFSVVLPNEDTYRVEINHSEYHPRVLDSVFVKNGDTTWIDCIMTKSDLQEMQKMTIRAVALRNTAAALVKRRQENTSISTAISGEEMSRAGVPDAAQAMKNVSGVTLVDGKYVYIRGLGDRYSTANLNGIELPSPNPDRNAVAFDLFPASLLDNIETIKTFDPSMDGNFSGGSVSIVTKAIPEGGIFKVSGSLGGNTDVHFQDGRPRDDFLTYEGGSTDWLGIDDGTRGIPEPLTGKSPETPTRVDVIVSSVSEDIEGKPTQVVAQADKIAKSFDSPFAPTKSGVRPDQSYKLDLGKSIPLGRKSLGFGFSLAYANILRGVFDGQETIYRSNGDSIVEQASYTDNLGTEEISWGALMNTSFRFQENHKFGGIYLYARSAEDMARKRVSTYHFQLAGDGRKLIHTEIKYVERGLHFAVLDGDHLFSLADGLQLSWDAAFSNGEQSEPDYRAFSMTVTSLDTGDFYSIPGGGIGPTPSHRFRRTEERGLEIDLDLDLSLSVIPSGISHVKLGGTIKQRRRIFEQRRFYADIAATSSGMGRKRTSRSLDACRGDIDDFLSPENMGIVGSDELSNGRTRYNVGNMYLWDSTTDLRSSHEAYMNTIAAYLAGSTPLFPTLAISGGVRYETIGMELQSEIPEDSTSNGDFDQSIFLPSVSISWTPAEALKVRGVFGKTFALPMFRELAPYESNDAASKRIIRGNPHLKPSRITNYDVGIEWYPGPGEFVGLGVFHKFIQDAIDIGPIDGTSNGERTWKNVGGAKLYGTEWEAKKNLAFIHPSLESFWVGGNFTIMKSEITKDTVKFNREKEVFPSASPTRAVYGSCPYMVKAHFEYNGEENGFGAGLFFTIFGEQLDEITIDEVPDGYIQPFPLLTATLEKKFCSGLGVKLSGKNLLGAKEAEGRYVDGKFLKTSEREAGRSYSLALSYCLKN